MRALTKCIIKQLLYDNMTQQKQFLICFSLIYLARLGPILTAKDIKSFMSLSMGRIPTELSKFSTHNDKMKKSYLCTYVY